MLGSSDARRLQRAGRLPLRLVGDGIRDASVLTTLTGSLGLPEPALGRLLLLPGVSGDVDDHSGQGGVIRVGDEVVVG